MTDRSVEIGSVNGSQSLTVIVPTYNVERYLERQIETVKEFADEILICDSFSNDGTLEIAARHGVGVIQHEYITSAKQKNWAIPQARCELGIDSGFR